MGVKHWTRKLWAFPPFLIWESRDKQEVEMQNYFYFEKHIYLQEFHSPPTPLPYLKMATKLTDITEVRFT